MQFFLTYLSRTHAIIINKYHSIKKILIKACVRNFIQTFGGRLSCWLFKRQLSLKCVVHSRNWIRYYRRSNILFACPILWQEAGAGELCFGIICKFWGTRLAPFISLFFGCLRSSWYHAYRVRTHAQCGGSSRTAETATFFLFFIRKQCCSNRWNLQVFSSSNGQKALLISEWRNVTLKWCINIYWKGSNMG